jgi:hypothetical protein
MCPAHSPASIRSVDCSFCHGAGRPFEAETNPRKDIARHMIQLVRQINRNFPDTGVFPNGAQAVTCHTSRRGDPHPERVGNRRYDTPK